MSYFELIFRMGIVYRCGDCPASSARVCSIFTLAVTWRKGVLLVFPFKVVFKDKKGLPKTESEREPLFTINHGEARNQRERIELQ